MSHRARETKKLPLRASERQSGVVLRSERVVSTSEVWSGDTERIWDLQFMWGIILVKSAAGR